MTISLVPMTNVDEEWEKATTRKPGAWTKRDKQRAERGYYKGKAICVDGEGYDKDGVHTYVYMGASNSDASTHADRFNPEGLSTEECFQFLVDLPKQYIKVGFSFDYDINMMLKDLDVLQLMILNEKGFVFWKRWKIQWTPRKKFTILQLDRKNRTRKSCTVWDIFGYFQTSFVKTIWKWEVGTEEELRLIAQMKERRSEFTAAEIAEISFYCQLECKLGAQVFDKLLKCTTDVGLSLRRYDGAGSVASAMLRKNNVEEYMHQTVRIPDEVICAGYYGGRFDRSTFGECGDAIEYDINSAYPYQAVSLPCLSCGSWEYTTTYRPNERWAIWNTNWSLDESGLWSPFPYRNRGHIYYLRDGRGWYWGDEVRNALRIYPNSIHVREGYVFHQSCTHQPFSFISEYFERRRRLKEQGDLAEMVLKLGLNSIYGKLAQNVGQATPKTQCLIWAGIITSNTRAMLLDGIRHDPDALLVATDAVISKQELPLKTGNALGEWERSYLQHLFIIGNGVYQARGAKEVKHRTRGVSIKDIYDPDNKIDHWTAIRKLAQVSNEFTYKLTTRRFVGLGRSLSQNPVLRDWRQWKQEDYNLRYGNTDHKDYRDGRLYPAANPWGLTPSQPFSPKNYRMDDAPLLDSLALDLIELEGDTE